ncbi:MAG: TetR family transcriptional regulator, partial [Spongiibacter marinus]|uniref:TetR/AcrR family transcriptional regulator n=1 Tax=Spongiibacter marinus TaxID=354246 RepID=UPI003C409262
MKALPTQQRALAKRNALISAAEHCFAKLGYEGCTAKIVAEHAEVATGTFYQYFDNKDDMLHTLAEQWFFELEHTLDDHQSSPHTTDIEARLAAAIKARGAASFAVSGGSTPKPLYQRLSHADLDWDKVTVVL